MSETPGQSTMASAGRRHFELIVFDWDGTLMDSAAAIVASVQAASRDLGLPVPPERSARHIIGLGLQDAMAYLFPQLDASKYQAVADCYRDHYLARDQEIRLFDGAREILEDLSDRGYLLGVATGKGRRGLDHALEATGLRAFFHASRCADEAFSKPHPAMLLELMDQLGVRPQATLMIGDTTHDLEMARNAGVIAVAVSYGAHPRDLLLAQAPLACLDSVSELQAWIARNA